MKVTTKKTVECLMALFLVLNCNSVYQRLAYHNLRIEEITAFLSVVFLLERMAYSKGVLTKKMLSKVMILLGLCLAYFLGTITYGFGTTFVFQFLIFLPCIILSCNNKINQDSGMRIYKYFSDIVYYTSIISTVVWFFSGVIPLLSPNMTAVIEWGGIRQVNGFLGISFLIQREETFGFQIYRNSGIFTEGPMLSLVLTLSLMYEAFFEKKPSKKKIIILCIIIFSTISISGIAMIVVIAFLKWWEKILSGKRNNLAYLLLFLIVTPVFIFAAEAIIGVKSSTASYNTRMIDYAVGIQAFIDHPVFGVGYNKLQPFMAYKKVFLLHAGRGFRNVGYSNGLFAVLGQGGIVLSLVYLFPYIYILLHGRYRLYAKEWIISYIILLAITIFHARFISIFFLGMFYAAVYSEHSFLTRDEAM